jgi:hypothetical protein
MAAQGGGEEGRKERTKSLPPPPDRTAQRRWKNLTEGGGDNQRKNLLLSGERRELIRSRTVEYQVIVDESIYIFFPLFCYEKGQELNVFHDLSQPKL